MKIIVYAIAKNESKFAHRWIASMSEADGIYVLDTGSDDDTVKILESHGAHVEREIISPWRFDTARNKSLNLVPIDADICVCTDLDEVFEPGWRSLLEKAWRKGVTRVSYRYTWNFEPDGSEGHVFWLDKIHARHGYHWTHPVHEVLTWEGEGKENRITVEGIQLNHHADPEKSRAQYLPLLETAVREAPEDDRNVYYLGREYFFHQRWDDCINMLKRHLSLPAAQWRDERCASMRYIARAYAKKGNEAAAEEWGWRAIAEAPYLREPFMELAWRLYEKKDWEGVIYLTGRALKITDRKNTYITENAVWGSLPWDLRSVAFFYTDQRKKALEAVEEALKLSPENERIQRNRRLILAAAEEAR